MQATNKITPTETLANKFKTNHVENRHNLLFQGKCNIVESKLQFIQTPKLKENWRLMVGNLNAA